MLPVETVNYTDSQKFDRFVREHYGIDYSCQRFGVFGEPCYQDTAISFTVDLEDDSDELWWDDDGSGNYVSGPPRLFQSWIGEAEPPEHAAHSEGMPFAGTIAYDLARQGLAPEGKYVIRVWW